MNPGPWSIATGDFFMLIGELSQKSGMSRDTIRYYEKRGLLETDDRRDNNYKEYAPSSLRTLKAIERLKRHGFTLGEISEFINLFANQQNSCSTTEPLIDRKLQEVDHRIQDLKRIKRDLLDALKKCETHPDGNACQVLVKMFEE